MAIYGKRGALEESLSGDDEQQTAAGQGLLAAVRNFLCTQQERKVDSGPGWQIWAATSGGRLMQTFSKVCMSLQSLRLGNFLQTFCRLFFMKCRLFADFLQTFSVDQLLSCTLFADFLHTFCSKCFKFCRLHAHLFCICRLFAEHMHTFFREQDSFLQTSCTPILDLMQT
jgi:hypothetical protein